MTPESDRLLAPAGAGAPRKFPSWRADAALVGNTIIWGSTFVLVQSALHDISPLAFLAIRFSIATLALILLFRGRIRFSVAAKAGMLAGICLFSGYVFQTVGLQHTTAANAGFQKSLRNGRMRSVIHTCKSGTRLFAATPTALAIAPPMRP